MHHWSSRWAVDSGYAGRSATSNNVWHSHLIGMLCARTAVAMKQARAVACILPQWSSVLHIVMIAAISNSCMSRSLVSEGSADRT